jgi:imidazolonepropionase
MSARWRIHAARVWTGGSLGVLEDTAIDGEGPAITSIGPRAQATPFDGATFRAGLVTPALVDAHTHAAWAGHRHAEYVLRMQGADYVTIAKAGGGIVRSHEAVAAASEDELTANLFARLKRMARQGVATVEVKSGYGLTVEGETKQLRAIARAAREPSLPRIVSTFLALHALPPGTSRDDHLARMIDELLPRVAAERLAERVDAYVDPHAFTVDEGERLFAAAISLGLRCTVHAGQFGDVGGAELAARFGAGSADHLEHLSATGAQALAQARTRAVLLPVASYTLRQAPPPVALLREAGVRLVVASDANPGTAPTESLPLAMALAVREYGLSVEEALRGATIEAAAALGIPSPALEVGSPATLSLWDLPHENALVMPWGAPPVVDVWREGRSLLAP